PALAGPTAASHVAASSVLCLSARGAYILWLGRNGSAGSLTSESSNLGCFFQAERHIRNRRDPCDPFHNRGRLICPLGSSAATKGSTTMATQNGTIKRITDKGFGFIAASDGTEYFFHQSASVGTRV